MPNFIYVKGLLVIQYCTAVCGGLFMSSSLASSTDSVPAGLLCVVSQKASKSKIKSGDCWLFFFSSGLV